MSSSLLEAEQVAEILEVKASWVYKEARAGRFPCVHVGRYVRFRRESVIAWVESKERGSITGMMSTSAR